MKFDPKSSESVFSEKDDDELIHIAYVEETYVSEAKELAKSILVKRGRPDVSDADIERVRKDLEARADAVSEHELRGAEAEEEIPSWRRRIRDRVRPYRIYFFIIFLAWAIIYFLDTGSGSKVLSLTSWQIRVVMPLLMLVCILFVMPDRKELKEQRKRNRH